MYKKIAEDLDGKNIGILGFGREGKSSYRFIEKHCPNAQVTILDLFDIRRSFEKEFNSQVEFVTGDAYLNNLEDYDLILKSPGISLKDLDTSSYREKISSQIELLLKYFSKNTIGITGTKGKSTTSSLIYEMIKDQRDNVFLVGNIGIPVLDQVEKYNQESILVMEMSSHQLEFLSSSPHIGIILNLFEDHLDAAGTLNNYHNIKLNMFKNQNFNDHALYLSDNEALSKKMKDNVYLSNLYAISEISKADVYQKDGLFYFRGKEIFDPQLKKNLLGKHNDLNIVFALSVIEIIGLDNKKAQAVAQNFKTVEYRNQLVGEVAGVKFYVDTLATIPEATIASIKALGDVDTLIFGGLDRGINYDPLIKFLKESKIKNFICMPTTGYKIGELLEGKERYYTDDLEDAVQKSKEVTSHGGIVLLSPAAASYEYYKDYKEKAEAYISFVNVKKKVK